MGAGGGGRELADERTLLAASGSCGRSGRPLFREAASELGAFTREACLSASLPSPQEGSLALRESHVLWSRLLKPRAGPALAPAEGEMLPNPPHLEEEPSSLSVAAFPLRLEFHALVCASVTDPVSPPLRQQLRARIPPLSQCQG